LYFILYKYLETLIIERRGAMIKSLANTLRYLLLSIMSSLLGAIHIMKKGTITVASSYKGMPYFIDNDLTSKRCVLIDLLEYSNLNSLRECNK
jgi:hypothetical protein